MPKQKTTPEEILHACWQEFHRNGYHHTSLQALANAAGLGKAGLLHHFGSKAGLMKAVLEYARRSYYGYVLKIAEEQDKSLEERIQRMLDRQIKISTLHQRGCFFANTILETGQAGTFSLELKDFLADWMTAVQNMLRENFPPEEAKERAYRWFIDYEGSVMLYKLDGDIAHLNRLKQRCVASLHHPLPTY